MIKVFKEQASKRKVKLKNVEHFLFSHLDCPLDASPEGRPQSVCL